MTLKKPLCQRSRSASGGQKNSCGRW